MPHPTRKKSRSKRDKRRSQFNARTKAVASTTCLNCGAHVLSHHACASCGYYRGLFVPTKDANSK